MPRIALSLGYLRFEYVREWAQDSRFHNLFLPEKKLVSSNKQSIKILDHQTHPRSSKLPYSMLLIILPFVGIILEVFLFY